MTTSKTVYTKVPNDTGDKVRLGASLDDAGMVHVWQVDGPMLGLYNINRFHNHSLTSGSLYDLFAPKPKPKNKCVGCFADMPGDHYRGCPTGQNGTPNYN